MSELASRALCWIRRDLRLHDHAALALACERAREVVVVFVYDTVILDALPSRADRRLTFIHRSLEEVDQELAALGARLVTVIGDPIEEIPQLAALLGADLVVASHDDEAYALKRDAEVARRLSTTGRKFETIKDHVVLERAEVLNNSGEPFRVFTPYSRKWWEIVTPADFAERTPNLAQLARTDALKAVALGNKTMAEVGFMDPDLWLTPGAKGGQERLNNFLTKIARYGEDRDIPGIEGTSGLSVHLRFGTVSIRECFRAAMTSETAGSRKWQTELIWREFYQMILAQFPHVGQGKAFKAETDAIHWPGTDEHFRAWCEGQTGYPIVDAAMRCFNATGWMHNRLRMVVAMFLTKDLLVDWRRGEAYFADLLLDFDLASNNGGWQWSASTGVDAQPYFRIFNPILQSRKFDSEGTFIREWCPELRDLDNKQIHWPFTDDGARTLETPSDYPNPIVLHFEQREKAMALFQAAESGR